MRSKWFDYKDRAIQLRKRGTSIRTIETTLSIPRSTLSGWFKNVELTQTQQQKLAEDSRKALRRARKGAVAWHNQQKACRLRQAEEDAGTFLDTVAISPTTVELALAFLYLGEGAKKSPMTAMGNSDPMVLRFFITALRQCYHLSDDQFRCELHIRADQDGTALKRYWAKQLTLPIENFMSVSVDRRTANTKTYKDYKGVCVVRCGAIAIQRKLVAISRQFCQKTA